MSGATSTPLIPSLRRPLTPPPHLFIPPFTPEVPKEKELKVLQVDPFFLPQVQTHISLIRPETFGKIFIKPQFLSEVLETVQVESVLPDETQLDEKGLDCDSTEKVLGEELHAELSPQSSLSEPVELEKLDKPKIVAKPSRQVLSFYNQKMKYFSQIGNIREVLRLFSEMKDSNCDINVLCYTTVINALVISGRAKDAQDMFDEMLRSGVAPNVPCFNVLVKLHSLFTKKFDLAYEVMAKMKEFGFTPDSVTYATVITGLCKAGRLEEAWHLHDFMIEEKCAPTIYTFTPIVEGFCLQGKTEEAKELMATMESLGCKPNTVTYNILISALCKAGRFDEVEKILEQSQRKGWIPNSRTYNTYMDVLFKKGMAKQAFEKLEIMMNKGVKPTSDTISILVNCLCSNSKFLVAQNLLQKNQLAQNYVGVRGYNTLMSRLSEIGRWLLVLKLFTDMFKKGIDPNSRTFNIVVHSLCRGGKLNLAKVLFTSRGFVRNTVSYNTILHWCFQGGRSMEAQRLLSDMAMEQIAPDEFTYGTIVTGLCREGKFSEATGLFLESLANGIAGDYISLFVNSLVKYRKLKEVLQVFKEMQEQGFFLDVFVFDATIRAFCRHGFCDSEHIFMLCLILEKMLEKTHEVDKCKQNFG